METQEVPLTIFYATGRVALSLLMATASAKLTLLYKTSFIYFPRATAELHTV